MPLGLRTNWEPLRSNMRPELGETRSRTLIIGVLDGFREFISIIF